MHPQINPPSTHYWRIPTAFWWIVAACFLAYSWQHLAAQTVPSPATAQAANSNNVDLSGLLSNINQTAQSASVDIAKLRIEKWKGDSSDKQQLQANADSVERNLTSALPGMITAVRNAPQDMAANFKLYRNMNALYDVMKTLTEASAAFGQKQDYQTLAQYADAVDGYRRNLADYMENLAASKDAEVIRLRSQLKNSAQAAAVPTKKVIIDDTAPAPKKSSKKKPAPTNPQ